MKKVTSSSSAFPAVGKNLHRERRRQQLSLDALASSSGVSKAMLSQIESDKVNPTIGTLWKIAQALNVEIEKLICGESGSLKRFEVKRRGELANIKSADPGIMFEVLSPVSMAEDLELYRMHLKPGCRHVSQEHSPGTLEFLTMLKGSVEVVAGDNRADLKEGDVIMYESDVEHEIANLSEEPAELHMVVKFRER